MDSSGFRQYALDWAKKLRDFETKFTITEETMFGHIPVFGQDEQARARYMAIYQNELFERTKNI
jgi:hypothetical protein